MNADRPRQLAALLLIAVISLAFVTRAEGQVAWVERSMYAFEVTNDTGEPASQFILEFPDMSGWSLYRHECVSSVYSHCEVLANREENRLRITWSQGTANPGDSASFALVLYHATTFQRCTMTWADAQGQALGQVDDVWPSWTTSGSSVYGAVHNRTAGARYVTRAVGYAPDPVSAAELQAMAAPPNALVLDPAQPLALSAGSSAAYDYSPYYLDNRSNFMFYEVYGDISATSPLIRFKSAAVTTVPAGGISFVENKYLAEHLIRSSTERSHYEVISAYAVADPYEDLELLSIVVESYQEQDQGSPTDVTVLVWEDINDDGKVEQSVDRMLGAAVLSAGVDTVSVPLMTTTIPGGGQLSLVVSYSLPASVPVGTIYWAGLRDAYAVGTTTGIRVPKAADDVDGGGIAIVPPPISIGEAKKLPLDPTTGTSDVFLIEDLVITALGDGVTYAEDQQRTAGIGVEHGDDDGDEGPDLHEGMRVWVMGRLALADEAEARLRPMAGDIKDTVTPLLPLVMRNEASGGGAFGIQPGVVDNALTGTPASGLNNVGMLVKLSGRVTGTMTLGGDDGETVDVAWVDDGSGLQDGVSGHPGVAVQMPADWDGIPLSGPVAVTGIICSKPGPQGQVIRMLLPRSMLDIKQ